MKKKDNINNFTADVQNYKESTYMARDRNEIEKNIENLSTKIDNIKDDDGSNKNLLKYIFIASGLLMSILLAIYTGFLWSNPWANSPADFGTMGDYLGGILNPLYSLIAIYIICKSLNQNDKALKTSTLTVQLQRCELELNRLEMEITNEALAQANRAYENQKKVMSAQRRQDAFFSFLKIAKDGVERGKIRDCNWEELYYLSTIAENNQEATGIFMSTFSKYIHSRIILYCYDNDKILKIYPKHLRRTYLDLETLAYKKNSKFTYGGDVRDEAAHEVILNKILYKMSQNDKEIEVHERKLRDGAEELEF